ncbi:MAG: D-alanyl-D-alanine carboxypeptidase [Clostridiales bacterium]|nr:D-alanyl-D-alanine carboxypeptidase [Clostridiales bacterium]
MLKKQICSLWLAAAVLLGSAVGAAAEEDRVVAVMAGDLEVNAAAVVVMDADSGRVLYAQNPDRQLANASTTKMMTALLTLEQPDRDTYFTVDSDAIRVEGTTMGLQEGDSVTLNQLAAGMLLPSGNDAAGAAAVEIAGSQEAFVEMMNARAAELGLENTHYKNPSGLDEAGHYSSARDLALLAAEALQNPDFADIVSRESIRLAFGNPPYNRSLYTTNKLLEEYPYAIGVKTGYTEEAGNCLVSAAEKDGKRLIVVTLNGSDTVNTHRRLYERYFQLLAQVSLEEFTQGLTVPVVGGVSDQVAVYPAVTPTAALLEREYDDLVSQVELPRFVYAPVQQGEVLGSVRVLSGDKVVYQSSLVADQSVSASTREKQGLFGFLSSLFH